MEKVLEFLASSFEVSCHLEFYLLWTQKLLMAHGQKLKSRWVMPAGSFIAVLPLHQPVIGRRGSLLGRPQREASHADTVWREADGGSGTAVH